LKLVIPDSNKNLGESFLYTTGVEFAFCSAPKKGEVELLTRFNFCRESATGNIWAYFNPNFFEGSRYIPLIHKLKFDKTRVVVRMVSLVSHPHNEDFESDILCGVRIANLIEREYGWDLSAARRIELAELKKYLSYPGQPQRSVCDMFYIESDPRWISSPQMMTFYLLLIRSGQLKGLHDVENYQGLLKAVKGFSRSRSGDKYHLYTALKYAAVLLKRHDELFDSMQKNYGKSSYANNIAVSEGIARLCRGNTYNHDLLSKFQTLAAKEGI